MLASLLSVAQTLGYPTLFLLIIAESAGVPLPGETALITAGVVASQGHLNIAVVIVVAAAAAILGDNIGYFVARKAGRQLLQRPGPFARRRRQVLETGEPFFARHGPKAVFLGRWVLGLRTWASWLAGASRMPWRSFSLWNALGGVCWATTVAVAAYLLGSSASGSLTTIALIAPAVALLAAGTVVLVHRRRGRQPSLPPAAIHTSGEPT